MTSVAMMQQLLMFYVEIMWLPQLPARSSTIAAIAREDEEKSQCRDGGGLY
jgi:hypothetical protein